MPSLTKIVRHGPLLLLNLLLIVVVHLNDINDLLFLSAYLDELRLLRLCLYNEWLLLRLSHTVVYLILLNFLNHLIEVSDLVFVDFYLLKVDFRKVSNLERKNDDFLLTRFIMIAYSRHDLLLFVLILYFLEDVFHQIAVSCLDFVKKCYHDVQFFVKVLYF